MSRWEEKRLGELIHIKHGFAFKGEYITDYDNGIVLVTPGNFKIGGGFKHSGKKYYNGEIPEDYILKGKSLIVTMTDLSKNADTLGYAAYSPTDGKTYLHNQRIGLVSIISDDVVESFLYWLLRTPAYQRRIANTCNGVNVKHTSPERIYSYKFLLPNKSTQTRIADILSSYDDLIENNNRRIQLLEQTAQELYKEWFVRFRFPGHENTKFENGLPEGWERNKIQKYYHTCSGGTPSRNKPEYFENGIYPWVKTGEIKDCVIIDTEEHITQEAINNSSAKVLSARSVAMAMYGVNIGLLAYFDREMTCNQACCVFSDKRNFSSKHYLYYYLKSIREYLLLISFGAAQQNLSQDLIKKIKITTPAERVVQDFEERIDEVYDNIRILLIKNQNLVAQRDLLLPRLMSGKMEV